jgi:excinuclease ABC subunit A
VIHLVVDRAVVRPGDEENEHRLQDSIQTAFFEGRGECWIDFANGESPLIFNNLFELDGMSFTEPSTDLFSFNNPVGACPSCEGFGSIMGIDEDLVIPNPHLSVYEGVVAPWHGETMKRWKEKFILGAAAHNFPIHRPYIDLNDAEKQLLWEGAKGIKGIDDFFKHLESKSYKIQFRVMLSRYRGRTKCPTCKGKRLRPESSYVKINNTAIEALVEMPLNKLQQWFKDLVLSEQDAAIAKRLLVEIESRLGFLGRCRPSLPHLESSEQHIERRREPAHTIGHLPRLFTCWLTLHHGRAKHRAAREGCGATHQGHQCLTRQGQYCRGGRT